MVLWDGDLSRPLRDVPGLHGDNVSGMASIQVATEAAEVAAARRLFVQYRRAVEGYASAADVCA